ncbi:hypothetical protein JI747_002305 [Chryseobacterium sp. RG1]|uniref:Uncharacterized protein n=1 Tax=Chryseobacterium tagetis TaxID=2801334 RepID=A0ABS7ZWB1_9FLAO|nr:hypothetical protein [Chryseobacterium tagetis]MCA6065991.1 hypothetical protein [Chryseobacterium tagetis]
MKKILLILAISYSGFAFSQVIMGDAVGTATNKQSVLLEFAAGQNKGIILPYVRTVPAGSGLVEGTFILDTSDATKAKVKYYNGVVSTDSPNGWVDLSSGHEADVSTQMSSQPTQTVVEEPSAKVIIGSTTTAADGVLVLESNSKALVLPIVQDTNDIADPAPGMMVYINKTGAKRLAVYNGGGWTYWKP